MIKLIYALQHIYKVGPFEEGKFIGIYSSKKKAMETVMRFKSLPGFNEHPIDCFHIDSFELDKTYWTEGFTPRILPEDGASDTN